MPTSARFALLGRVVTPDEVLEHAAVVVEAGRIVDVAPVSDLDLTGVDRHETDGYVLPGLVDLHNHGGAGVGFPDPVDAATTLRAVREHRSHGTTTMLASLVTAPPEALTSRIRLLADLCEAGELAGIHLEGPFLSAARAGAQDVDAIRPPDAALTAELIDLARGHLATMTLAPELPGADDVVAALARGGALPSFGHTDADAATTRAAIAHAARLLVDASVEAAGPAPRSHRPTVTHLFNGMRPFSHRDPGPIPAILSAAARGFVVVELIGDGVHLDPSLVRDVVEIVGRDAAVLVTDSTAATGMPDGAHHLADLRVTVTDGVARLADGGALAGSTSHLIDVVRTVHGAGVPLVDAVFMASAGPARVLGRTDVGRLAPGTRTDVVLTDHDLRPTSVYRDGDLVR
ncbi:N-acetylglucosamine-6-phosphate deacetylase [Georgenia sp. Z1491]|uniref:N-acetylglucosamine-6-phosphate deacetylase n=1 Tax=Georgenia sp. Z1491 TaxID=3416707 RepID=UPI003CF75CBD